MLENQWIDAEFDVPVDDRYVLLSFSNYPVPQVGRYEENDDGGNFCLGDDEESCLSQGLIVNAWMPLPDPYED